MPQVHYRTCSLCEAMCGIAIEHEGDQILSIKGDKDDPFSRGHICPKAVALKDLHEDPDRLKYPLKKTPTGFEEISWEEAFSTVADRLKAIQAERGNNAVGVYVGNPTIHNYGAMATVVPFIESLRTRNRFSATSVDQLPHMLASKEMFGHQALLPVPDIDRCDYFICLGANPMASNGSVMSVPDAPRRLKAVAQRGKLVVIDPRFTETSSIANEHLFIKPGRDALLLLAMAHEIFANGWVKLRHLAEHTKNLDTLKQLAEAFPPEKVAPLTGMDVDTIKRLTREYALSKHGVLYARIGACVQEFGTLNLWLVYALNIITGHFDREGGYMFTRPAIDVVGLSALAGMTGSFDKGRSRVHQLPEFNGEYPVAELADNILTPGEEQIRALVTCMGNPVLSLPNGNKMDQALASLDFMVSIDLYLNETSRHADIILPTTGPLEHGHFDFILQSVAIRNTVKWSDPLFRPEPGTKHDWEVYLELATRLNSRTPASTLAASLQKRLLQQTGIDWIFDLLLRTGPYGHTLPGLEPLADRLASNRFTADGWHKLASLARRSLQRNRRLQHLLEASPYREGTRWQERLSLKTLKVHPHGIDLGPLKPVMPERIYTPDGLIDLAPEIMADGMAILEKRFLATQDDATPDEFLLIGRRHVRSNNSWLHNSHRLVKGKNRCTAMLNADDARRLRIQEGDIVEVTSRIGTISLPAEVTDHIMPGVISIPHGWGHNRPGSRLRVAEKHAGVSLNDIVDDQHIDPVSGMSALNGIQVTIRKAPIKKPPRKTAKKTARKTTRKTARETAGKAVQKTTKKAGKQTAKAARPKRRKQAESA